MPLDYPPDAYDRHLALKPSLLLILVMFYSARHLLLVLLAYNPSPKMAAAFAVLQPFASPYFVLADIPALLVLLAWAKRVPESKALWRALWRSGRILLSLGVMMHFALLFALEGRGIWGAYFLSQHERLVLVNLGFDLLVVYYLWRSARVADVFADFPSAPAKEPVSPNGPSVKTPL
jgi:glucan phosphoethanolaminetransferase (alkaline phosphatase superfamily)